MSYARNLLRMRVGEKVRKVREARGLSQKGLAELSGVSEKQIWNIENGANCSLDTLRELAAVLDLGEMEIAAGMSLRPEPQEVRLGDAFSFVDPSPKFRRLRVEAFVAAGHGGWEDVGAEDWHDVPERLVGPNDFLVQAVGESMIDEGINDGDYVLVTKVPPNMAPTGEIVIAWLNDGLVIKRWGRRGGRKVLYSQNPDWPEREVTPSDVFEIQAVVKFWWHKANQKAAEFARKTRG